ncbi:carboxymuconolactone decarboxylase family protein [Nesterenkonia alkaliphila]|uniref:carboxymuconolactone decarboxylase family protein n=1 Tax=Nesterenkonia alkaliphila TaxID=1463631 RepID=UPI00280B1598|nr:carboxymuconolactone decarboxylase family protein [Nesterenkonia alkaliphila]
MQHRHGRGSSCLVLKSTDTHPEGYQAVIGLETYLRKSLDPVLLDLVKLRASQINECAFCVDMHATDLDVVPREVVNTG